MSQHWRLYPVDVLGKNFLKPAVNSRKPTPIEQVPSEEPISEEELQRQQQLLMDYVRQAVTQENVNRFADQALEGRETISARDLAAGETGELIKIIGLHTYSQSHDRNYELTLADDWVTVGGIRFQQFWIRKRS